MHNFFHIFHVYKYGVIIINCVIVIYNYYIFSLSIMQNVIHYCVRKMTGITQVHNVEYVQHSSPQQR